MRSQKISFLTFGFLFAASVASVAFALPPGVGGPNRVLHEAVDETKQVTLMGNTRPEAMVAANDRGKVADNFPMSHLLLQLKRSPESESALKEFIDQLHDPNSSNFHQWLTPAQFAAQYGVAQEDIDTLSKWLLAKGFTIDGVAPTGLMIEFSGTAGQVHSAFGTEIHNLSVEGNMHFANMTDPRIPAALEPLVAGLVSLHNFMPKPLLVKKHPQYTYTNSNGTFHALAPGDIETIYNINPLLSAGISGKGQSIMVVEDTYLYSTGDWTVFRKTFGLARPYPYGTLSQVSPAGAITCANPGFQGVSTDPGYGDDGEAAIDVEWATAAAPNAAVILAACTDTATVFGGLIALLNTLNGPAASLPSVVSISYGESEEYNGAAANLSYNNAYQQAVAEGVSIFVSSGDENAASSDGGRVSTHGITVSGFTSTPYNVSVGGLDFGYTALGVDPGTYWNSTNSNTYASALSYIQEIPWNNSCASGITAFYLGISPLGLCNNAAVTSRNGPLNFLLSSVGGSGGPSACATGVPASAGRDGGTCAGYAKPAWQSGLYGNPADGVRDTPDVALFASNGFWDAYYVVCWSNPDTQAGGGFSCTGPPSNWAGFGGTSVSSPIMAGIQALVNQKTGSRWGNPNTTYYALANGEYGAAGSAACNSALGGGVSANCIFYDVTQGDNDSVCRTATISGKATATNCYIPAGFTYGVLSTSNTADQPAYLTNVGWDFASGIGSVNAYNLVMNWPAAVGPAVVSKNTGGNQ
jgi:subtilase family serine protease